MRALLIAGLALLLHPAPAGAVVAFRDSAGRIVVAKDDGSSPRVISRGRGASVSPDGRWLAYFTNRCGCNDAGALHLTDLRSGDGRVLARNVYRPGFLPAPLPWSPDSRRVAVSAVKRFGGYVIDVRTRKRLFIASDFRFDGATFSPRSTRLIYADSGGNCGQQGRIVLFAFDTRRRRGLSCGEGAVWGRRGFAFLRGDDIYVAARPGRPPRRLIVGEGRGLLPVGWSADGSRLLVVDETPSGLQALILDRRTGITQTVATMFTAVTDISRDGRTVLGESDGDVVAAGDDGTTAVLAEDASAPSWTR